MNRAIFITVRLKSTRLPRKAMLPLAGRPLIIRLIERMKQCDYAKRMVLCTSDLTEDDPLERLAEREGIESFRGDAEDVLLRLRDAAISLRVDNFLNVTGDNPFVDPDIAAKLGEFHERGQFDFSLVRELPLGSFGYALKTEAVERACRRKQERDTEIWGGYFTHSNGFTRGVLNIAETVFHGLPLRLTVDTPEDFALASKIAEKIESLSPGRLARASLTEIAALCAQHPEWLRLNAGIPQKMVPEIHLN